MRKSNKIRRWKERAYGYFIILLGFGKQKKRAEARLSKVRYKDLLIEIQSLKNLLITFRIIHLKVRKKFAAAGNHSQKTAAG